MSKRFDNLSGTYTYKCVVCGLAFLPEELPERYIKKKRTCLRCLISEKSNRKELELPHCYGKKYDALEDACVRYCTLANGCIIETVDFSANQWALERQFLAGKYKKGDGRKTHFAPYAVRLLRAAGRPMHVEDIAPLIAYQNGGIEQFIQHRSEWINRVRKSLLNCSAVVHLGISFFIWAGIWNLRDGGTVGGIKKEPKEKLISIEEIFRDL